MAQYRAKSELSKDALLMFRLVISTKCFLRMRNPRADPERSTDAHVTIGRTSMRGILFRTAQGKLNVNVPVAPAYRQYPSANELTRLFKYRYQISQCTVVNKYSLAFL
jgi:hypothetical protein